ncbi:MAG: hypothetical protein NTV14_00170 [Coprothermobacterota bacterium]|nr:hypothetical protein [Coprothermobacterota bacterium]
MRRKWDVIRVRSLLRYAAIAGNVIYVLWIVRNGISEGFRGRLVEVVSLIGLLVLLILNAVLLCHRDK